MIAAKARKDLRRDKKSPENGDFIPIPDSSGTAPRTNLKAIRQAQGEALRRRASCDVRKTKLRVDA
jgi:hypothetical protein